MASPQELAAVLDRAEVEGPAQALFPPLCWGSAHLYHCGWGRVCRDGLGRVLAPSTSLPPEAADAAMDLLPHPGWPARGFLACCWCI